MMSTSKVAKATYQPLKTMDSSEKNASKKSTQLSKQFSVTGVLSFFSSGRTPSQNNKKPIDYASGANGNAISGQQAKNINNSMHSPNADGNPKQYSRISKGRSPPAADGGAVAITGFHD